MRILWLIRGTNTFRFFVHSSFWGHWDLLCTCKKNLFRGIDTFRWNLSDFFMIVYNSNSFEYPKWTVFNDLLKMKFSERRDKVEVQYPVWRILSREQRRALIEEKHVTRKDHINRRQWNKLLSLELCVSFIANEIGS